MPDVPAPVPAAEAPGEAGMPRAALLDVLAAAPLPSLLVAPGPAGEVRFANPAARALLGEAPSALAVLGAEPEAEAALRAFLASGGPGSTEVLLRRRDGATLWGLVHLSPLPGPDPLHLVQIVETSRRRDLEAALGLAQRREALGQLTNGVAHEFNNLLQILVGYVDGLRRRLGEHPDAFVQRALSRSTDAAERASSLTRHLLAFSRRHRPEPRPVDLNGLLREHRERALSFLGEGIGLELDLAEDLWIACIDPVQTELILQILLGNAAEAMPAGGRVTVQTRNHGGEGVAADGAAGRHVALTVADTGAGMPPEVLARALEPFFTTREPGRGTGLAILNALVKRQNGAVALRSSPGEGTVVRLTFPAAEIPRSRSQRSAAGR
ncbi:His Kinase A (phospho-acceptor) domain-containing protein [Methylobacterium sp. 174MFSha1.1]|uniref:ATP-binding protein n=1 Tax=Methylobacterium sp. 174MFSha1.1 TaxID=1502749 RepID=UPI0008E2F282|nr:ATP-binding protein [Methylobacterium sp. 174MFSha1.1]SFV07734.1 His Kinase A (phospho-acceptor) domain-containing protein [Methylobacterium sp. 174MFSha1.1]